MYPTFDPMADYHSRVERSLDAYARLEKARSLPSRPGWWHRIFPRKTAVPRPAFRDRDVVKAHA